MGLLYQPLMIDEYGALVKWQLAGENQSTQGAPTSVPLCHPKPYMDYPGTNPRAPQWEASDQWSYGTAVG
jgi:hypothetical protein